MTLHHSITLKYYIIVIIYLYTLHIDMKLYFQSLHYWPEEHKNEFAPLLSGCQYSKGSLAPISFTSTLSDDCLPLPPLREHALPFTC